MSVSLFFFCLFYQRTITIKHFRQILLYRCLHNWIKYYITKRKSSSPVQQVLQILYKSKVDKHFLNFMRFACCHLQSKQIQVQRRKPVLFQVTHEVHDCAQKSLCLQAHQKGRWQSRVSQRSEESGGELQVQGSLFAQAAEAWLSAA